MAWFDDQQHSVGSLCAQLSGDTSTVQGVSITANFKVLVCSKSEEHKCCGMFINIDILLIKVLKLSYQRMLFQDRHHIL